MGKESQRGRRVAEEIRRLLSEAVRREVKDPGVPELTITEVEVTRDLSSAKVYFSCLDPEADTATATDGLQRAAGFLRSLLAKRMTTRTVPQLRFHHDTAIAQGDRMTRLLAELNRADDGPGEDDGA